MLRLRDGDDLALGELMERWQESLGAFIYRYTGNKEDALDLAQETFVHVYDNRARYQPTARFSTWLFKIAANLCRNHARWQERHPTVALHRSRDGEEPDAENSIPASEDTPADSAERNDLASAVRDHIQQLPHDLRTVVILFEYQDLGYQEIAAALNCSPKAVETRLYRARKILREALAHWKV
jgi:RNA polymerase sigma-70 factor, ECF subfamily